MIKKHIFMIGVCFYIVDLFEKLRHLCNKSLGEKLFIANG